MRTRNKVTLRLEIKDEEQSILQRLLVLRRWCRNNLKDSWRTYELTAGGNKLKYFVVFEFDSKKDEMMFKLYTGK